MRRDAELGGALVSSIAREFPTLQVRVEVASDPGALPKTELDGACWLDRASRFEPFDAHVDGLMWAGKTQVDVASDGPAAHRVVLEMLTRWQRWILRRNDASNSPRFSALLASFRQIHDLSKPLVLADLNHALDTWQWVLRLDPAASLELQVAALLHDVERLESEADARVEQHAPDYARFKAKHADRGSQMARSLALSSAIDAASADRIGLLVSRHESPHEPGGALGSGDSERALLNDADALSFFSQNSSGYLDYFGPAQTRKKLRYTWSRMRPSARERVHWVRLRGDVQDLLRQEMAGMGAGGIRFDAVRGEGLKP